MRTETKRSYVITNINYGIVTAPTTTTTTTTTINPYSWWNVLDVNIWGITADDGGGSWMQNGPLSGSDLPPVRYIYNANEMIDGYSGILILASWLNTYTKTSAFCGKLNSDSSFNISNAWRPTKLRITYEPADLAVMIWLQDFNGVDLIQPQLNGTQLISSGEEVTIDWHNSEYDNGSLGDQINNFNRQIWVTKLVPVDGWKKTNFRLLTFEMYGDDPYNYI